jgi:hypothetical protein
MAGIAPYNDYYLHKSYEEENKGLARIVNLASPLP